MIVLFNFFAAESFFLEKSLINFAILASSFLKKANEYIFLTLVGGINTANMFLSLITLYVSNVVSDHFSLNPEINTTGNSQAQANQESPEPNPIKNSHVELIG